MSKYKLSRAASATAIFLLIKASLAYAEVVPEEYTQRMEALNYQAVSIYAGRTGKTIPTVEDYRYGMKMDVEKVIHVTPTATANLCGNVPRLMTYENSGGELKTIRYSVSGNCRNER
ncbi:MULTISPECIES: DUF2790 domain-containing protein [Pseudomonas]|uniref:DUF2790 domain-containing protein n=1 Tax=Pseudomonas nitroreducens TaxID=46680 RepID=A0A6G6J704_PSENT|nr:MULTISPECIES: DUF2790 domain-containing protein [Pseudomonas]QIE91109.1 DUF2790 domain-containing protein [Pseudomonas nitroreducens]UCL90256.1 DUF2790 domain-containing protein [Pseudomonas sp. HS-18]